MKLTPQRKKIMLAAAAAAVVLFVYLRHAGSAAVDTGTTTTAVGDTTDSGGVIPGTTDSGDGGGFGGDNETLSAILATEAQNTALLTQLTQAIQSQASPGPTTPPGSTSSPPPHPIDVLVPPTLTGTKTPSGGGLAGGGTPSSGKAPGDLAGTTPTRTFLGITLPVYSGTKPTQPIVTAPNQGPVFNVTPTPTKTPTSAPVTSPTKTPAPTLTPTTKTPAPTMTPVSGKAGVGLVQPSGLKV